MDIASKDFMATRELSRRLEAWGSSLPSVVQQDLSNRDSIESEIENDIYDTISRKFQKVISEGYGSIFTGEEIKQIVAKHQEAVIFEFVDEVVDVMMYSLFGKLRKKHEKQPFNFFGFFYVLASTANKNILENSFCSLFPKGHPEMSIVASQRSLEEVVEQTLAENKDTNGVDIFTQVFFDSFKNPGDNREPYHLSLPEEVVSITIKTRR